MGQHMKDRRKDAREVTPQYEDSGIFKNPPKQLNVELVPKFGTNSRNDVMIKGFIDADTAVDVVFAGRRKAHVEDLVNRLRALWTRANRNPARADRPPEIDEVRLPVRIEGSWRPRFERDDQGWQTRTHQLFAARWLITGEDGEIKTYGEVPIRTGIPEQTDATRSQVLAKRTSRSV